MMSIDRGGSETMAGSLILVVDDRHHDLFILERRLLSHQYQVTTASSGQQALDIAFEKAPDLILLDVGMSEMDGFAVKEALNQNDATKDVPVVFVSRRDEIDVKRQAFDLGAEDFLAKPFHSEELLARIKVALRHHVGQRRLMDKLTRLEEHMKTGGVEAANEEQSTNQLEQAIQAADSQGEPIACLYINVTGLDELNNPPTVRAILMGVANILTKMINPATDTVTGCEGQGEYLLFASGMSIERATILAEGVRSQITATAFADNSAEEQLKLSIGISGREAGSSIEPEAVLAGAREAMQQAVDAGSGRVVVKRVDD